MVLLFLAALMALSDFGHAQKDTMLQFPEETTIQVGHNATLHCNFSTSFSTFSIIWYQQHLNQSPQFLLLVSTYKFREGSPLCSPWRTPRCFSTCKMPSSRTALSTGLDKIGDKLVFGSGTTLTVEPSNQKESDPEVVLIKSKALEEGGSTGKAACLARNFYPKNISLDMLTAEVIYEQSPPVMTSEGTYNTIKVVNVAKKSEVSCTAKFKNKNFPANATSSEKVVEEPITANVCNTTDISSKGDIKTEKTNMLSMAVLGLRVLLAKSIAFNTLMSIKLFLF